MAVVKDDSLFLHDHKLPCWHLRFTLGGSEDEKGEERGLGGS